MPNVVILDQVTDTLPDYCTHGYASCVICKNMCWMGSETSRIIEANEAVPICLDCALVHIPPGTQATDRVEDHKRRDGPHE